jgi:hypothetical protein
MLFEDDDCEAWLPVGRMHSAAMSWSAPAVEGTAFPSS